MPPSPGNLIDPAAAKMMSYFPLPNLNVGTPAYNPYNNYFSNTKGISAGNELNFKIDHRFTDRDLLSGKYVQNWSSNRPAPCFASIADPCSNGPGTSSTQTFTLNYTRTLTSNTVATINFGAVRNHLISPGAPGAYPNFSPVADLGLPSYVLRSGVAAAPYVTYNGGYTTGAIGTKTFSIWNMDFEELEVSPSIDMNRGKHDIKIGGTIRMHRINFFEPGAQAGSYAFSFNGTSEYPTTGGGNALASFLIGIGAGNYLVNDAISPQSLDYAAYVNDTWRITPRLTLNVGLRYEIAQPQTERFNRIEWIDPSVKSPLQVPGLPTLYGGAEFANNQTRTPFTTRFGDIGPRVGIAWHITEKTVLRTGYGIFYSESLGDAAGITGGAFNAWNYTTNLQQYAANGATPYARFSDPFPGGGPAYPPGNSQGLATSLGLQLAAPVRDWSQIPSTQTWSFGLQRALPGNMLLSANYVGTKGTHLYFGGAGNLDVLGSWVESATPSQLTALYTKVSNPFYGYITDPNSTLRLSTVSASQLALPYPQYTSLGPVTIPVADSIYNSLQVQAEKRYSQGLQIQAGYTWSKSIDDSSVVSGNTAYLGGSNSLQDPNKRFLERSLSQFDVPQNLQLAVTYDLPWGRGRTFGTNWSPWLNTVAGGWKSSGIWIAQSGFPLALTLQGGQSLPTYGAQRPNLLQPLERNTGPNWMTQYFADPGAAVAPTPLAIGNAPRTLPIRAPGIDTATLALFKDIPLPKREGMRLQIRAETFNVLNHPQFSAPNTAVGAATFGLVTGQHNSPRQVQFGAKLYF